MRPALCAATGCSVPGSRERTGCEGRGARGEDLSSGPSRPKLLSSLLEKPGHARVRAVPLEIMNLSHANIRTLFSRFFFFQAQNSLLNNDDLNNAINPNIKDSTSDRVPQDASARKIREDGLPKGGGKVTNVGGGSNNNSNSTNNNGTGNNIGSSAATTLTQGGSASGAGDEGPPGSLDDQTISYSAERIIGNGSFGVVFQATVVETKEIVAIKKVLQDKRFKNRELQIMRQMVKSPHSNIVSLKHCFYSQGDKPDELYLNLVLEFVEETVYSISRQHQKSKIALPILYVKLYMYQLCRALCHIHSMGICHRDIKPQNLLLNPSNHQLKLCDFGSAKVLVKGEPNVSYICSRYYRSVK